MQSLYNTWLVGLSIAVAMLVSYTALRLAARVATSERPATRLWLAAGALAMGVGIWSMHFIGMLAFSLPIPLAYDVPTTLASLGIAVVTSGFALILTSGEKLTFIRLAGGAVVMGAGICAMHYTGMAAIAIVPGIDYDPALVALSIVIAVTASFVALWLFFRLRDGHSHLQRLARVAAAIVMGLAISGMHYTAMAAARFALGSFCRGGVTFDNRWLAATIGLFALGLLVVTLVTAVYDAHLQSRMHSHAQRLEVINAELQHQATHDALTGLPNRTLCMDRLGREIAHAERDGHRFGVLLLDLDRFKLINDSLGHGAGDQLLAQVARRLTGAIRDVDTVARTGGDEFLLLIADTRDQADLAAVATQIGKALGEPFLVNAAEVHTSASIGISVYPADGIKADALVARADEAMYFAKERGRNAFEFFNLAMSVFSHERLELENDLRRALALKQLEVHYQPKSDVMTGRINSVEALLRWRHPTRGLVSPADFIPLAEDSGLILSIGEWVLREACQQARQWQRTGLPFLRIAVNVSPVQFRQSNFLQAVRTALLDFDLEPQYLEIELTETTVMDNAESSIEILEQLSRMGVVVSIDDFGTGYSSMSYLRRFPIDKLKIDRSFISELTTNAADASIVQAIISLAHSLRLKVVAEGVETAEQLELLRTLGCDQYQGFYHSAAVPPGEIEESVRSGIEAANQHEDIDFTATQSKLAAFKVR
ncbi:MAG TPA: EAL domain-containing protein [Steroidobacteraceae bacterium]|nr:EAL domain-containing protein [Steroidobacteraceae bacterium]